MSSRRCLSFLRSCCCCKCISMADRLPAYKKDGGWGWVVVVASFIIHAVIGGIAYSCGVYHSEFLHYFGKDRFDTAWLGAILMAMTALGALPGTLVSYMLGYRATVVLGGLVAAGGLCLSMLCTELWHLYLTLGVMTGTGFGLALTPSVLILDCYFFDKRSLAASIAVSGSGVGIMLFPIAAYHLEKNLGWKGMGLIFGGTCIIVCLCAIAFRSVDKKDECGRQKRKSLKIFAGTILKTPAFQAMLWSNLFWSIGASIIFMHLPDFAVSKGVTREDGAMLIGVIGISMFSHRLVFQLFSHSAKLDHMSSVLCTVCLAAILTGLFPELFKQKAGMIGYSIIFGMHIGYWTTFVPHVAEETIGEEYIAHGRGYQTISVGLGLAIGPPLAGWIYDSQEDFEIVFYLAGACLCLGTSILLLANMKRCYYRPGLDFSDCDSLSSAGKSSQGEDETLVVSSVMTAV